MTRHRPRRADPRRRTRAPATTTDRGTGRRARLLAVAPVVALLALLCLIFLSWTSWGFETDPVDQLRRDAPWVALAALTGAVAGAMAARALTGRRDRTMAVGAVLGALPAAFAVSAYFTGAY